MEKRSLFRGLVLLHICSLALLTLLMLAGVRTDLTLLLMAFCSLAVLIFTLTEMKRQLNMINSAAQRISRGETGAVIPELELAEFDAMGKNIGNLISRKDDAIGHLAAHREELRLLIDASEDPLWAQDSEGRVLWANEAFSRLFPGRDPRLKPLHWELIREPELLDLIRDGITPGQKELREISLQDHHYLLTAARDQSGERGIYMLQNIDALRSVQQMKRDFIVNLAHELRTPLTAIKGFTEALEEDESQALVDSRDGSHLQQRQRYLKIIQNHTNRLISLIADLEELILLERGAGLSLQELKISELFDNLRLILEPMTEAVGVKLSMECQDATVELDPFKLEQVFINLAQNSIHHGGATEISISASTRGDSLLISFADNGKGIPAEHLERVFERFWVGEASRNRSRGGTGLGLAIVKHIIALHRGSIKVSSELGKGTRFEAGLPLRHSHPHD